MKGNINLELYKIDLMKFSFMRENNILCIYSVDLKIIN